MIRSYCAQRGSLFVGSLLFISWVEVFEHGIVFGIEGL